MIISLLSYLLIPMTLFGALGGVYFKKYASKKKRFLLLGLMFYGFGALINLYLLKHLPYTLVFPANALTYIWAMIFAKLFFKEPIKANSLAGVLVIALGLILLIDLK